MKINGHIIEFKTYDRGVGKPRHFHMEVQGTVFDWQADRLEKYVMETLREDAKVKIQTDKALKL